MQLVIIEEKNLATVVQLYKNIFHLDEQASVEMKNRIEKHRQHDQFFGMISYDADVPTGLIYGYQTKPGQFFHEQLKHVFDNPQVEYWLSNAYELVEFGVIEAYRSKGVGSALHDAFLEKMNTDKCILSVKATNQTAIAFYEHKGWKFIKQSVTIIPRVPKQHIVGKKLT